MAHTGKRMTLRTLVAVGWLAYASSETQKRRIRHRRRPFIQVVDELSQFFWPALFGYQRIAAAKANERTIGLVILSTALHDRICGKGRRGSLEVCCFRAA